MTTAELIRSATRGEDSFGGDPTVLDLSNRALVTVPDTVFAYAEQLKRLDLSGNQLERLPAELATLKRLVLLGLLRNRLSRLPDGVFELTGIKELYLGGNAIVEIPNAVENLSHLEKFSLASNRLTALPPTIVRLRRLKKLFLYRNQLRALPRDVGQWSRLEVLYVNSNRLTSLPASLASIRTLRELHVHDNDLPDLPHALGNWESLEILNCSRNRIASLPPAFTSLSSLHALDVRDNRIADVAALFPILGALPALKTLELSRNRFVLSASRSFIWANVLRGGDDTYAVVAGLDAARVASKVRASVHIFSGSLLLGPDDGVSEDTVQARITGPEDSWVSNVQVKYSGAQQQQQSHHRISFTPTRSGPHTLELNFHGLNLSLGRAGVGVMFMGLGFANPNVPAAVGEDDAGAHVVQEYAFNVRPAGAVATKCALRDADDCTSHEHLARCGVPVTRTVIARDALGRAVEDEEPALAAVVHGPRNHTPQCQWEFQGGGEHVLSFVPLVPGPYALDVTLHGESLSSSRSVAIPVAAGADLPWSCIDVGKILYTSSTSQIHSGQFFSQPVAIKRYRAGDGAGDGETAPLHAAAAEIAAAEGCASHPSIVAVVGAGWSEESGGPYLVMERLTGGTLAEALGRGESRGAVLTILLDIATALQFLHEHAPRPWVHGAVHSSNVVITADGRGKLIDFGRTGPCRDAEDVREDIVALGVLVWEVLMLEPCGGRTVEELRGALRRQRRGGGVDLADLCKRCWDEEDAAAESIARDLRAIVQQQSEFLPTVSPAARARDPSPMPQRSPGGGAIPTVRVNDEDDDDEEEEDDDDDEDDDE